jgi:hypothetical protein
MSTFRLPEPPWGTQERQKLPRPAPTPPREQDIADRDAARDLAARVLATMPDAIRQEAEQAYQASVARGVQINAIEAELRDLASPAPRGASIEERGRRALRQAGLESLLADVRDQGAAIEARVTAALTRARAYVQQVSGLTIIDAERQRLFDMQEQADQLAHDAAHGRIALASAKDRINAWLPEGY